MYSHTRARPLPFLHTAQVEEDCVSQVRWSDMVLCLMALTPLKLFTAFTSKVYCFNAIWWWATPAFTFSMLWVLYYTDVKLEWLQLNHWGYSGFTPVEKERRIWLPELNKQFLMLCIQRYPVRFSAQIPLCGVLTRCEWRGTGAVPACGIYPQLSPWAFGLSPWMDWGPGCSWVWAWMGNSEAAEESGQWNK